MADSSRLSIDFDSVSHKIFSDQPSPIEPKVKVMIPTYEPLETSKCEKSGRVMAESKELIDGNYKSKRCKTFGGYGSSGIFKKRERRNA